jgi:hypothetical protein
MIIMGRIYGSGSLIRSLRKFHGVRQREHPFTVLFHKDIGKRDHALLLLAVVAFGLRNLQSGNYSQITINIHLQLFAKNRTDFIGKGAAKFEEVVSRDLPARAAVNEIVRQNAFENARVPAFDRVEYLFFEKQDLLPRLVWTPFQPPITRGTRKWPSSRSGA